MINKSDFIVIGAGVVGLAISLKLLKQNYSVLLLEKNSSYGLVSSSHNSGVIHSGAYYQTGSLKHHLSIKGKNLIYEYLNNKKIPFKKTGKLFISLSKDNKSLNKLYEISKKNGLNDLTFINKNQIQNIDSKIKVNEALLCPSSGILDQKQFLNSLFEDCKYFPKFKLYSNQIINDIELNNNIKIKSNNMIFESDYLINSSGLNAPNFLKDKIGSEEGISSYPVYGAYLRLANPTKLNTIIYTSLNPGDITERVDATPTLDNNIIFGPSIENKDFNPEVIINKFKPAIKKYLDINYEDLVYDYYGTRPKAKKDNKIIKDFLFLKSHKNILSLVNIESPGLTACLSIADYIFEKYI